FIQLTADVDGPAAATNWSARVVCRVTLALFNWVSAPGTSVTTLCAASGLLLAMIAWPVPWVSMPSRYFGGVPVVLSGMAGTSLVGNGRGSVPITFCTVCRSSSLVCAVLTCWFQAQNRLA